MPPLRRFAESYARHRGGIDHDLVVVYKGFSQRDALGAARSVFSSIPHSGLELTDAGLDIGSYLAAAAALPHEYVCFVNTFSEIVADDWLGNLHRFVSMQGVGIAGATGSYESLKSSLKLTHKVRWLCNEARIGYDERLVHYYDFILELGCRVWKARGAGLPYSTWEALVAGFKALGWRYRGAASIIEVLRSPSGREPLDEQFERHWNHLLAPGRFLAEYAQFPAFPNPHIRSNAFMIERRRLLEIGFKAPDSKIAACAFESGADSLSSRLRRQGLRTLVVDKHGRGHDLPEWSGSATFRLREQEDLLVHDKQTRSFDSMSPGTRLTHRRLSWGDYLGEPPGDFPDVGLQFPVIPGFSGT